MKAKIMRDQDKRFFGVAILCPACKWQDGVPMLHTLETDWVPSGEERSHGHRTDGFWQFNGDLQAPTFAPSLLINTKRWDEASQQALPHVCHSFIRDGQIQFLGDCTHALAGQTVDLLDVEA